MALFTGFSTHNRNQNNNVLEDVELVKRDLLNHFHTRLGERLMNPEFGSIIWDMLFEPLTESNVVLIRDDVDRIIRSDPRVSLQDLDVVEKRNGLELRISVLYVGFNVIDTFEVDFDNRSNERTAG